MAIDTALQAVDELLQSLAVSDVSLLQQTSQHILGAGGKRLRPRLVLLASEAVGAHDLSPAVPLAAAVEIIHTATLVHDDINDHGTLRRGRETVNARWGGTFALLTGDYLFTKAYLLMAPYAPELNMILAKAAMELVEGETQQIQAAKAGTLDRALYFEIIAKKTASLFVAATSLGATVAHAPEAWISALNQYAYNLGLAFQITDDILDLVGEAAQMGKNAGIDVSQGRGLAVAIEGGNGKAAPALEVLETAPGPFRESLLRGNDLDMAVAKGREKVRELAALASAGLDVLPPSAARDELYELVRLVAERDH